jgi:Zn-dependent peptidase ImmA (M78 family)
MLPEEKIACRFSKQRKLQPPVDTESLVREFAILEEDSLPEGYDAVYLDKSAKHPKPRVIITNNISKTRRVFTLGHELGHILIPWHIGTHFCRVGAEAQLVDHLVREVESQANRFAAELLMPTAWVEDHLRSAKTIKELVRAIKEASVSYLAASFRLQRILPEGYVFVETDPNGKVLRAQKTGGTKVNLPSENDILDKDCLDDLAEDFAEFDLGNSTIFWWRLADKLKAPGTNTVEKNASDLLKQILQEVIRDENLRATFVMRINGVIGAANGSYKRDEQKGDLFTIMKQRFAYKDDFEKIASHPSFDTFLQKRVEEIALKG